MIKDYLKFQKNCLICGTLFIKKANFGKSKWENKKYCSRKCSSKALIGITKLKHTNEFKEMVRILHTGKVNSIETRKKMSVTKIGKLNPQWKGGVSEQNHLIRNSMEYKLWREAVIKRDNYTCTWCFKKQGWSKDKGRLIKMHIDHIKPFALFPELRFAIDNGRTLCVECHMTTDTWGVPTKKQNVSLNGTLTNL